MPTALPAIALLLFGLAVPAGAQSADEAWRAVEARMEAIRKPDPAPKNKAEFTEHFQRAFAEYGEAKQTFLGVAPADPRRWAARWFEVEYSGARTVAGLPGGDVDAALTEILAAPDAPAEVRTQAGARKLLRDADQLGTDLAFEAKWKAAAEAWLAAHPEHSARAEIEERLRRVNFMAGLRATPLELKLTTLDGREVDLGKMRGKVVLIDVWATWCLPCLLELPRLKEVYQKHHAAGFEIVGISLDKELNRLKAFLKDEPLPWPQCCDGLAIKGEFAVRHHIESAPVQWLVDKEGHLAGPVPRGGLEREVLKLLAAPHSP